MGVMKMIPSFAAEAEEVRRELGLGVGGGTGKVWARKGANDPGDGDARTVCLTGGTSFLGLALLNRLLAAGFTVRLAVGPQEGLDKVREEREIYGDRVSAVAADLTDVDSLSEAFHGCAGVFNSSSFIDSTGVSGYTKHMAELEEKVAERVVEACARTPSVRKCVFTSSLLACIWTGNPSGGMAVLDEKSWSHEGFCRENKLWLALGKTMAERAAWRVAKGRDIKLVTICPALATGPGFNTTNSTASIAYLKGAKEMFAENLLATVDVGRVADAHVAVYEEMGGAACGRYICFDDVVTRREEVEELSRRLGVACRVSNENVRFSSTAFQLCDKKLRRLITARRRRQCSFDVYSALYN